MMQSAKDRKYDAVARSPLRAEYAYIASAAPSHIAANTRKAIAAYVKDPSGRDRADLGAKSGKQLRDE
jgi:hypothetical protein